MGPEHRWEDREQEDPADTQFRRGQRRSVEWSSHAIVTSSVAPQASGVGQNPASIIFLRLLEHLAAFFSITLHLLESKAIAELEWPYQVTGFQLGPDLPGAGRSSEQSWALFPLLSLDPGDQVPRDSVG